MRRTIYVSLAIAVLFGCSKPAGEDRHEETIVARHTLPEAAMPPAENSDTALDELKEELGKGYVFGYQKPFAIAGNITQDEFDKIKDGTIKSCSEAMERELFDKKPDYTLKVYLFRGAQTYEAYVKEAEGRAPSTPYGYYQDATRSLVMNIETGTGTLVHEMVHALIRPDFPDVPAWLNEGMGSLYEQCRINDDGSLRGRINWRYPILMKAANNNKLVPLKKLFSISDNDFYNNKDASYAEARYFCLYLQENDFLPKFYKKFRDNFKDDKTGVKFLEELFGKKIDEIDSDWQKWIPHLKDMKELR